MTGARVPEGADSVQKVENTAANGNIVKINKPTKKLQNVVTKSAEITRGTTVFKKGTQISRIV